MSGISQAELRRIAQIYIREVFADRLRQQGFWGQDGNDFSWYRLVNSQVVHSIQFFTRYTSIPVILEIGFGFHPLFITPSFHKGPYLYETPGTELMFGQYQILKQSNRIYSPNILINCPADEHMGRDILDRIFSIMDPIQTPLDCYTAHKSSRAEQIQHKQWFFTTPQFVDEVVYWNDRQLYPFCCEYVTGMLRYMDCVQQSGRRLRKNDKETVEKLKNLYCILFEDKRDEHLEQLKEMERQTLFLLAKHTGIQGATD